MILNLFDVPKAIFYRKCYKDKQTLGWAQKILKKSNIYPLVGFDFGAFVRKIIIIDLWANMFSAFPFKTFPFKFKFV